MVGEREGNVDVDEGIVVEVEVEAEVEAEFRLEEATVEVSLLVVEVSKGGLGQRELLTARISPGSILQLLSLSYSSTCKGTSNRRDVCFCVRFCLWLDKEALFALP